MPILGSCCFCLDLKVGTKWIGVLNLIISLINSLMLAGVIVMFVVMGLGASTVDTFSRVHKPKADADDDYVDVHEEKGPSIFELITEKIATVTIILYILLAVTVLNIITSSMLIHGVKRNRRGLLIPHLILELVIMIVLFAVSIWSLVSLGTQGPIVYSVIGLFVSIGMHLYFWLVIFSQYQALGLIRMHEEISMK